MVYASCETCGYKWNSPRRTNCVSCGAGIEGFGRGQPGPQPWQPRGPPSGVWSQQEAATAAAQWSQADGKGKGKGKAKGKDPKGKSKNKKKRGKGNGGGAWPAA